MNYIKIIVELIALLIAMVGIVMIYDARRISKKWFSYSDTNKIAKLLKGVGFIISIFSAIVVILNL